MSVTEIKNATDATARLMEYFDTKAMPDGVLAKLAHLLDFLSNPERAEDFRTKLNAISKEIWLVYNRPSVTAKSNRFTASICTVGANYGFSSQDNVVFVGALDGKAFGQRLKDGVLWKDSFALDHGEFSHSYQWLAAGLQLNWGTGTAGLYKQLADIRSTAPLFVVDNGKLQFRRAPLWEYLVDCTNYSDTRCGEGERRAPVEAYVDKQLNAFKAGKAVDFYFGAEYLRKHYAAEFFDGPDHAWKPEFDSPEKRSAKTADIKVLLNKKLTSRETFVTRLINNFSKQNAITGEHSSGTYRSPNNVSYLVRSKPDWFINTYQIHRTGRRTHTVKEKYPPLDGDAAKAADVGKLGRRGQQGADALKTKFQAMNVPQLDRDGNPLPDTVKLTLNEMKSGNRTGANKALGAVPPVQLNLGARIETFRSINVIEGARHAQHEHYQVKAGYAEIDRNVYKRLAADRAENAKEPSREVTYHGEKGQLHGTLNASIAINK